MPVRSCFDGGGEMFTSGGDFELSGPVGSFPFGVVFDGANIWVSNTISASVTHLSLVK